MNDMDIQTKVAMAVFGAIVIVIMAVAMYGYLAGYWEQVAE